MAPKSRGRKKPKRTTQRRELNRTEPKLQNIEVNNVTEVKRESFTFRSGPIPSSEDFLEYAKVDPSFPDRIMKMAERQQRASNRNKAWEGASISILTISGQIFAFLALGGILGLIYYGISEGNDTAVKWLAMCTTGIIGVFIYRRTKKK